MERRSCVVPDNHYLFDQPTLDERPGTNLLKIPVLFKGLTYVSSVRIQNS